MHSFALVPPPLESGIFASVRERLDPEHARRTIPHLTMKQPFSIEAAGLDTLLPVISSICADHGPVPIELVEAGVFDTAQFGSVLHLRAERSASLDALHGALLRAVDRAGGITKDLTLEREARIFFPHLTLAQDLSPERARAALAALELRVPLRFDATELVLGVRGDDRIWRRPHTIPLAHAR